jgi:hypothetical protein
MPAAGDIFYVAWSIHEIVPQSLEDTKLHKRLNLLKKYLSLTQNELLRINFLMTL